MSDYPYAFTRCVIRDITNFIWLCVFYVLSVYGEYVFLITEDGISAINPASGIFLAALLLSKINLWWFIVGAFTLIDVAAGYTIGNLPILVAVIFALSLAIQAVVSALILQYFFKRQLVFDNPKEIFALLFWSCTLTVVIFSIPPSITSYVLLDGNLLHFMWHWTVSNATGILVVCPLLISCYTGLFTYIKQLPYIRRIELLLTLITLILITAFVFVTDNPKGAALAPYSYLIFPPLIWVAMRFKTHIIFVAAFILAVVSIYFDYQSGQYIAFEHLAFDSIEALQVFLLIVISVVYLLAALSSGRELAAEELQYERGFSESVLNSLPGVVYCYDKNLKFLRWNKNLETVLGYSSTEIAKMSPLDFFDGVDRDLIEERIQEVFDKGVSDAEAEFLTKEGKRIPYYFTGLTKDIYGTTCLIGVGIDLSQRRQAEMELKASEQRLRKIMDGLGPQMLVGLLKTDGTLIEVNQPALEIAGLNVDDVLGKHVVDTYWLSHSDETRQQMLTAIDRANHGEASRFDMQIRAKEDHIATIDFSMQPLRNQNGEIEFLLPSANDITERVELEIKRKNLAQIIEGSLNEIYVFQADSLKFIFINSSAQKNLRFTMDELKDMTPLDIKPEYTLEKFESLILSQLINGKKKIVVFETVHKRKDGTTYPVEVHLQLQPGIEPKKFIAIILDISERKQTEKKLKENEVQLLNSQQKLRNLATRLQEVREEERTHISREIHDQLGQSLTGLRIDISWILEKLSSKNKDLTERMQKALLLADLTLESVQKLSLELRPLILDDLGLKSAFEWQAKEFMRRTNCQCNLNIELNEAVVTDKQTTGLFRILQESLTNVSRHAKATEVNISLQINDKLLYMNISDNGQGINTEQLTSNDSIGLIGMRERAEALSGQIKILQHQSGGTHVQMILPIESNIQVKT